MTTRDGIGILEYECIRQYTRNAKDELFDLSPELGTPGIEFAPLSYDERVPETNPAVIRNGYTEPVPVPQKVQHGSFFKSIKEIELPELSKSIETAFRKWDTKRSGEVVYKTDGLDLILQQKVGYGSEANPNLEELFFTKLGADSCSLEDVLRNSLIPRVKTLISTQTSTLVRRQTTPAVFSHIISNSHERIPAIRVSWWLKLIFWKESFEPDTRLRGPGEFQSSWTTEFYKYFGHLLFDLFSTKRNIPANTNARKSMPTLGRRLNKDTSKVTCLSTSQLTSSVDIKKDNLDQWLYLWSILENQFESQLLNRSMIINYMLTTMSRMHVEKERVRQPLPLCLCHLFVSKIATLAPVMTQQQLSTFWKLCCKDMRLIVFSSSEIQKDPASKAYMMLLSDIVEFAKTVTPSEEYEKWKLSLNAVEPKAADSVNQRSNSDPRASPSIMVTRSVAHQEAETNSGVVLRTPTRPQSCWSNINEPGSVVLDVVNRFAPLETQDIPNPWNCFEAIFDTPTSFELLGASSRVKRRKLT